MTREEVIAILSPTAAMVAARHSGSLEKFIDDVIKLDVPAEELERWMARGLDRKSDGPEIVCASIMTRLWSCGSFSGYWIVPIAELQQFNVSDVQYLFEAVLAACGAETGAGSPTAGCWFQASISAARGCAGAAT
jgi:hypothetical protein